MSVCTTMAAGFHLSHRAVKTNDRTVMANGWAQAKCMQVHNWRDQLQVNIVVQANDRRQNLIWDHKQLQRPCCPWYNLPQAWAKQWRLVMGIWPRGMQADSKKGQHAQGGRVSHGLASCTCTATEAWTDLQDGSWAPAGIRWEGMERDSGS